MPRVERFRNILAGLTSWGFVEQCDAYVDVSVPDDHPHQAETVLAAALALSDTALRESRMGPKLKEAIYAYRKAMTPKGTE